MVVAAEVLVCDEAKVSKQNDRVWISDYYLVLDLKSEDHQFIVTMSRSVLKPKIQNIIAITCQGCGTAFSMLLISSNYILC